MKLPSFQFYPGDWMKDPGLRSVSLEARGLWIDMLCLLFEGGRRGYLQHATGKPVSDEQLARMTGSSSERVSRLLQELEDSGVFSRTEHGTIYSRRMLRDERKRKACSEAGKKGGGNPEFHGIKDLQPTFKGPSKGGSKGSRKGESKQNPNPSSSSSFSTSKKILTPLPPKGGSNARNLFLIFWECYPLKVKKPKALAAFLKLKPDRALFDRMLAAIGRQKQSRAWRKDNGQFIPHPATWLNNRQWEDEIQPDLPEESVWDEFIGKPEKEES
jgi:biotin operon repressor